MYAYIASGNQKALNIVALASGIVPQNYKKLYEVRMVLQYSSISFRERPVSQHRQNLARKRRRIARLMTPDKSDRAVLPPASLIFAETLAAALLAFSAIVKVK